MKTKIISVLLAILPLQSFAGELLTCNMINGLQAVRISEDGGKFYAQELSEAGSLSDLIKINPKSWAKKNMLYTSPKVGKVHLYMMTYKNQSYWAYELTSPGMNVNGNCQ